MKHYARPSLALGTVDDLGVLKEDESVEDILRRQLLEKDRECDKVRRRTLQLSRTALTAGVNSGCSCRFRFNHCRPN